MADSLLRLALGADGSALLSGGPRHPAGFVLSAKRIRPPHKNPTASAVYSAGVPFVKEQTMDAGKNKPPTTPHLPSKCH